MPVIIVILATALLLLALLVGLLRRQRQAKQRLSLHGQLLDKLSDAVLLIDRNGQIRQHNRAALHVLGKTSTELLGSRLQDCLPQLTKTEAVPRLYTHSTDGSDLTFDISRIGSPHEEHLLLLQPSSEPDRSEEDAERFKRSQYFARIGTWDWDIDTNRLYWSEAIYAMFGHAAGSVEPSYELFCASVHPDDREHVRAGELRCIESGENHDEEYRVVWPNGSVRWLRETGNVIKNEHGVAVKMMGVVRDITEEKDWAQQLHQLAHHDALTGLPNRLVFEDRLRNALERARRSATRVALVFIDLNGFKAINDTYGHMVGDQVLTVTAQRLQDTLRASDSVARIGGDEFVVVIEGLTLTCSLEDEARTISNKLLRALSAPLNLDNCPPRIGASLGIAIFPDHSVSMDRLIYIADLAMYEAKRSGDNQYRLGSDKQQLGNSE